MRGRPWTEAEIGALRDLYPDHRTRHVAVLLGRPERAVADKAGRLGLHKLAPHPERLEAPSATLAEEIARARAEWATAPAYRPGGRDV